MRRASNYPSLPSPVTGTSIRSLVSSSSDGGMKFTPGKTGSPVLNIFDKKQMKRTSQIYGSLMSIGVGAPENSSNLAVFDPKKFNMFAEKIRTGKALVPPQWKSQKFLNHNMTAVLKMKVKATPKSHSQGSREEHESKLDSPAAVMDKMLEQLNAGDESCLMNDTTVKKEEKEVSITLKTTKKGQVSATADEDVGDDAENEVLKVVLNEEQKATLDLALNGLNLYIGGAAGTGKTVLLRSIKHHLSKKGLVVGMTATTGIAACNVNGSTFHHALGVDIQGDFLNPANLLRYDVIIIDEISMMDQGMLHKFDRVMRDATGLDAPFGGVQIIVSGDFLQLECVSGTNMYISQYFIDTFTHIKLVQQVRQADHPRYAEQLAQIRVGDVPDDLHEVVKMVDSDTKVPDAVYLMPRNSEVDAMNKEELAKLATDPIKFDVLQNKPNLRGDWTPTVTIHAGKNFDKEAYLDKFLRAMRLRDVEVNWNNLAYYRWAADGYLLRVRLPPVTEPNRRIAMSAAFQELIQTGFFSTNLDKSSRVLEYSGGLIVDIDQETGGLRGLEGVGDELRMLTPNDETLLSKMMKEHPVVKPMDIKIGCRVLLRANLNETFVNGSVGTVEGFVECNFDNLPPFLKVNTNGAGRHAEMANRVEKFARYLRDQCGQITPMLPVVKFGDDPKDTITIPPWDFSVGGDLNTHHWELGASCLPLTLAYAFTVHKVQGLTLLGKVHINIESMWECHHLMYVAMSRVKNPDQITIAGFDKKHVTADPNAIRYEQQLLPPQSVVLDGKSTRHAGYWVRGREHTASHKNGGVLSKAAAKRLKQEREKELLVNFKKQQQLKQDLEEMVNGKNKKKAASSSVVEQPTIQEAVILPDSLPDSVKSTMEALKEAKQTGHLPQSEKEKVLKEKSTSSQGILEL